MSNPIAQSTTAFLDGLDETVREAAEDVVSRKAARVKDDGITLTLEEEINLAKAIKYVAATDGFSRDEQGALEFLMIMASIPHELQRHVMAYDVSGLDLDQVSALFPRASRKAAYVLSGATTVAAFDGLSPEELARARELGERFGLEPKVVEALIAHAWAMGLAMSRGDRQLVEALQRLQHVLLGWV
ncbi:MAG: hypothetical protein H6712_27465 [Myxococcales bacterium]|nr:hypothetical protein [Myxococcales bacterium]MCB9717617.1 hypothetical protein [Myxococcales bacterium]